MGLRRHSATEDLRTVVVRDPPRDLEGLLVQLGDADPQQRHWAVRDLAAHPEAVPRLVQALVAERDAGVRERLFGALAQHPGPSCAALLLPLLHSDDAGLRNGAVDLLAGMPEAVEPHVERLLGDADVDARLLGVQLVGQLHHPRVRDWLLQVLGREPHVNVVAAAIEAVAEVGQPEDVAVLDAVRARFAADPFIGFAADVAVRRLQPD